MSKRYQRILIAYILISLVLIFIVLNLNDHSSFDPIFNKKSSVNRKSWAHEFVRNLSCNQFIDGRASVEDINKLNKQWNYSDEFFFDRLDKMGNK